MVGKQKEKDQQKMGLGTGDLGRGMGDWGLGTGDWGQGTGDGGRGTGDEGRGTGEGGGVEIMMMRLGAGIIKASRGSAGCGAHRALDCAAVSHCSGSRAWRGTVGSHCWAERHSLAQDMYPGVPEGNGGPCTQKDR